jgi:hypothetical protein
MKKYPYFVYGGIFIYKVKNYYYKKNKHGKILEII